MINLYHSVQGLPLFFAISVFLLAILLFLFIAIFPLYLALKSEVGDYRQWKKSEFNLLKKEYIHSVSYRLSYLSFNLDKINVLVGRWVAWLFISMILMQFAVVLMRYVFSWGSIQMQESIWYMHGLIFTFGVGYTLYKEGHVRIDILYGNFSQKTKAWVNIFGVIVFVFPLCFITLDFAIPYVANAWAVKEGSTEGMGLHYVYLLKSSILIFAVLLLIQSMSLLLKSIVQLLEINKHSIA